MARRESPGWVWGEGGGDDGDENAKANKSGTDDHGRCGIGVVVVVVVIVVVVRSTGCFWVSVRSVLSNFNEQVPTTTDPKVGESDTNYDYDAKTGRENFSSNHR